MYKYFDRTLRFIEDYPLSALLAGFFFLIVLSVVVNVFVK